MCISSEDHLQWRFNLINPFAIFDWSINNVTRQGTTLHHSGSKELCLIQPELTIELAHLHMDTISHPCTIYISPDLKK